MKILRLGSILLVPVAIVSIFRHFYPDCVSVDVCVRVCVCIGGVNVFIYLSILKVFILIYDFQ